MSRPRELPLQPFVNPSHVIDVNGAVLSSLFPEGSVVCLIAINRCGGFDRVATTGAGPEDDPSIAERGQIG